MQAERDLDGPGFPVSMLGRLECVSGLLESDLASRNVTGTYYGFEKSLIVTATASSLLLS